MAKNDNIMFISALRHISIFAYFRAKVVPDDFKRRHRRHLYIFLTIRYDTTIKKKENLCFSKRNVLSLQRMKKIITDIVK